MMESSLMAGVDDTWAAGLVSDAFRRQVEAETEVLSLAADWGHRFEAVDGDGAGGMRRTPSPYRATGGEGTPLVDVDASAEFATLIQTSPTSGHSMIADALDLVHRLPVLWDRVQHGEVRASKARYIARATRRLSLSAAGYVDRAVAGYVTSLPWSRLTNLVDAKIIEADPAQASARAAAADAERFVRTGRATEQGLKMIYARVEAGDAIWFVAMVDRIAAILSHEGDTDPIDLRRSKAIGVMANPALAFARDPRLWQRLLPTVDLRVHVHQQAITGAGPCVARIEGSGPVTIEQLRRFLGDRVAVRLRPVIDLNQQLPPVDQWEIPARMRERVLLRMPPDMFPYAAGTGRRCDIDHTTPYRSMSSGGPPGQTREDNLGPFGRTQHLIKTRKQWRCRQPAPDVFVWRSPHGLVLLVDADGTHPLGESRFADAVWHAAAPSVDEP